MTTQQERPRGILTPDDRAYLAGQKDLSDGAERNTRQRIRERIRNSLFDARLLWEFLPENDLEQTFYPDDEDERHRIRSSSQYALSLLILGLWMNRDPHPERLEDAITQAFYANNKLANVNIEIETEPVPTGDLLLATLKHKEERIREIQERLRTEELRAAEEAALKDELEQEFEYVYLLFERALKDPTVDAEALSKIHLLDGSELTAEGIEEHQKLWTETVQEREPLPVIVDKEHGVGKEDLE
ncbi:hypothetical protein [Haloglomus litoreum]|uniref:hypothetical protein n=1 Tax=Haloglomus litoreum TaxID=3034026 RepID=UPI0023E7E93B|nr:hypothetical protein [Haloglomus sp. DT116]